MLHKNKTIISLLIITLACFLFCGVLAVNTQVYANETTTISPVANLYELSDNNNYNFEGQTKIESFAYGKSSLGIFSISGNIEDTSVYRNRIAYGVSSNLSFSYSYDGSLHGNAAENWNISSDTATSVDGYNLTGSVGQGVVLIQTSTNGSVYETAVNPVTDFFKDKSGKNSFYTTAGADAAQGKFYRVIIAYETCRKTGTSGIWPFKKDVFEYKNNVEVYEFYVCRNDALISIHNLSVDVDSLQSDGYTLDTLKDGETLVDGSTTTKGFSIDKLGTSYLVSVAKNDESAQYVEDGASFTDNGKYTITTITKLGKTNTQKVYIFNGGDDKGFATYFDDYIIHGNRVYRNKQYPIYAKDSVAFLKATSEDVPSITGLLENTTTGEHFSFDANTRDEQSVLLTAGEYRGTFYSGNSDLSAGSYYRYNFRFEILDEGSSPYVNYNNLIHTQNLEDLSSKHYEVAYPMTHGGYVFVCFSLDSYQEAFNYAYEIEGRFIEKAEDNGLYYKSEKNPNKKEKYYDPIELTRVRNIYAKQNVDYNYFNATDKYTYRTLDNIDELEGLNLPQSVKVFASKEEKEKLVNRQPFVNNFTFIKVADFDVMSVQAYCYKNGKTYPIEFGKSVSEQLSVSSKYKIIETNVYGDVKEYDVYFLLENLTKSEWNISYNGVNTTMTLSVYDLEAGEKNITADSITVKGISNDFDSDSIVTIKAPDVYSFEIKCLLSELKDVELYKKGQYEITFIDRLGNSYKLIANITGKTRYSSLNENSVCFTQLYNDIYLNKKTLDEENVVNIEDLKTLIETEIEETKYTSDSYNIYKARLLEAKNVYDNPNATQQEINVATQNLKNAIESLVLSADKTELKEELDLYESLDKEKYTTASFVKYTEAYNDAKRIYANDASSADDVSAAVAEMKTAYSNLIARGDKAVLQSVLKEAKAVDCLRYTPKSIEELNEAFNIAYEVFNNKDAIQTSIDQAAILVNAKINSLVLQSDFSLLEEYIIQVKQIDANKYNRSTIDRLKKEYDKACKVFNDRNSTQTEVNIALANIQIAYNALVEIGDIEGLRTLLEEIKGIKWFLYSSEDVKALKAQYDSAIDLLNDDAANANQVSSTMASLKKLKGKLSERVDKTELYNYLVHCESVDLSNKSNKTAKSFKSAYENAYSVLLDLGASETDVAETMHELQSAENGLKDAGLAWWAILLIVIGAIAIILIVIFILNGIYVWW